MFEPYSQNKLQLHFMDFDSFILSFDTNNQELVKFLQQKKDEFDFSEFDKSHELHDPINKKVIGKMKIETSPVLVLDRFTALRSKLYIFSYQRREAYNNPNGTQSRQSAFGASGIMLKAKQKGIQKAPKGKITRFHCLCPKKQMQQFIQFVQTYNYYQLKNKRK